MFLYDLIKEIVNKEKSSYKSFRRLEGGEDVDAGCTNES